MVLVLLGCLANIVITMRRSLFLVELDGRVERIEVRAEKHPGFDDIYLIDFGSGARVVDAAIAQNLAQQGLVTKNRMDSYLASNGSKVPTPLSRDTKGMLIAMPLVSLVAWITKRATQNKH